MSGSTALRISAADAQLVVVDVQEKMLPHIAGHEAVLAACVRMIRAAGVLGLPVTISEQYVRGLGPSVAEVLEAAREMGDVPRMEKLTFSVAGDAALRDRIESLERSAVLLVGVETHVCVQQTALDLIGLDLQPVVLADAVSSRRVTDRDVALARMRAAGAVVTTVEAVIFEMLERAGTETFKRILPLVK